MFSLSTPWALAATALAAWLLWRARTSRAPRTRTVSNLFLWIDGRASGAPATSRDRPRPPWLVWLQAFILCVLAMAAAGPTLRSSGADAAVIIDVSASMAAREPGGSRLDLARAAARSWIDRQPPGSRVRVIASGREPRTLGVFRATDTGLASTLTSLQTDNGRADFSLAVTAARTGTRGPIAVMSDAPPPNDIDGASLEWVRIGTPLDNVAVTSLRAAGFGRALVEVQNFGRAAAPVTVALERNRTEIWKQSLVLASGESRAFQPTVGGDAAPLTARLRAGDPASDALASDDVRTASMALPPPTRVLLVTSGNRFLEQALRALPDVTLTMTTSLPASWSRDDGINVCDRCATAPPRPSLWLPSSGSAPLPDAAVSVTRADHALLGGIDFSDARVVPVLISADPSSVIATAAGRPLVAADETSQGRQVVLAADLAQSSLPLTVAFPVLVANTVAWLSERTPTGLGAADISAIAEADLVNPQAATIDGASPAPVDDVHSWLAAVALAALLLAALEWTVRRQQPWTRLAAVVAMAGAIAGARVPGCTSGRTVLFAIDGSGSVAASRRTALERVRAEMQTMASGDRAGLVVFGDHGTELREPGASRTFDAVTLPPASAATNIAAGIQAAVRALPRDGDRRVVLLTDGQATMGDVRAAADDAHARIDVIPLDDRETTVIRRLEAPVEIRSGAAISLRAEISGAPGTRLSVDLLRDGATVGTRTLTLGSTGRASAIWTDTPSHAGVSFYRATAMDPRLGIVVSEAGAGVTVSGRAHVLVITDHPGDVAARVRGANTDVDERAATVAPDTRAALAPYSAVVLDAVAPHQLTARQLDAISDAVALDGAGLLMLGSRESLNASEFAASRFSDSLPIDFTKMPRPPSASMALALLIDTSGSMAATSDGVIKIAAARDAVTRALSVLPASDAVQVIGFSATPSVIVPSGDPRDPTSVAERLRSMSPNGGTALAPALAQAMAWLRSTSNPVRRVLLVSDGRTTPADGDAARAAVSGQGIEVSVVAIGSDADRIWLSGLTRATGGRAYFPETLRELPRDVAREAARGAGGREVDERFRVRAGSHPLAPASPPELGGYVAGQLRPGATAAWKSTTEDPVLAAWPFGLGRVAVFASDLRGRWSAPLASWTEGSTFWQRTVAWLARAGDASAVDAQLDTSAIGTRLIVDTGVANDDDTLPSIFATIVAPSGSTRSVPLHAVSASRAETALPLADTGDYRATIVVADPRTGRETRFMRGWFWSGDREAQARGLNPSVLQHIADASGGTVRPAGVAPARGSGIFDEPRQRTPRSVAVALLLLAAGLLFWDYSRAHSREAHR